MKISLNLAQKFSNVPLNDIRTEELVRKIGAQLGAVEGVWQSGDKYNGVVVAKIVSCQKHPDADKLNVCFIDDGGVTDGVERDERGFVQVVCGAPNAREGLLVAWLPPGSTVPSTYFVDPFVLGARELRGVISNGMLASPSELAISDNHDGILEIEEDVAVGTPFKQLYDLDDVTIEVENKMFTHRPDCFGVLGVARELAGMQGKQFVSPDWYTAQPTFKEVEDLPLEVSVECPELVPRFMAVAMKNITVSPSPRWLQATLTRVALKPINNVVDITNYLSYVTAQPLHAYDYDKVRARSCDDAAELIAKKAKTVDPVDLLNGKTMEFADPTVLIATSVELIGVGGVMGGKDTEVDSDTKNIIIEVASFDMYNIRRTSMKYGLFTDAVTRFNKGQSPLQNDRVITKAMEMIAELAGGEQASRVFDVKNYGDRVFGSETTIHDPVMVSAGFINERLGLELNEDEISQLLKNVEFEVDKVGQELEIQAPFWRTDIEIAEDIVEEVGRLYGYDKVPLELPLRSSKPTPKDPLLTLKQEIRTVLGSAGANEVLTYSFVHGNLLKKVGQDEALAFKIANAISPDLQFYRLSLVPSLLDKVHQNIKQGYSPFVLFEMGKAHIKTLVEDNDSRLPIEEERLAFVFTSDDKDYDTNKQGAPYYQALQYLDYALKQLNVQYVIEPYDHEPSKDEGKQLIAPFDRTRTGILRVDGKFAGIVGELRPEVVSALKLPQATAAVEIDLSLLQDNQSKASIYKALSKFPSVEQDISLKVPSDVIFSTLSSSLEALLSEHKPEDTHCIVALLNIFQKDEHMKNYAFRVIVTSDVRTLQADAINTLLDEVAVLLHKEIGAERI